VETNRNILDNYLHQKAEEASFAMQEAHWQHALQALEKQEKKKRRIFGWWRMALLVGILAGSTALYSWWNNKSSSSDSNNTASVIQEASIATIQISNNTKNSNAISNLQNNNKVTESLPATKPEMSTIAKVANENQASEQSFNKNGHPSKSVLAKAEKITTEDSYSTSHNSIGSKEKEGSNLIAASIDTKLQEAKAPIQKKKIFIKNKNTMVANTASAANAEQVMQSTSSIEKEEEEEEVIDMQILQSTQTKLATNPTREVKLLGKTISVPASISYLLPSVGTAISSAVQKNIVKDKEEKKKKVEAKNASDMVSHIEPKKVDSIVNTKQIEKKTELVKPTSNSSNNSPIVAKKADSIIEVQIMPLYIKPKNSLIVSAAASAVKNVQGSKQAIGISPWLGIGYQWHLGKKWSLTSQLGFTYLSSLPFSYQATVYNYGFGMDSSVFLLQQQQLYQLSVPVSMQYHLGMRHALQFGLGANLNAGVKNKVTPYGSSTSSQSFTYQNGFSSLQPYVMIGYQLKLSNHLFFSTLYNQGLTDITKNAFHKNTTVDKASRLQIGFTYKLQ
jgi:hypothetical protein